MKTEYANRLKRLPDDSQTFAHQFSANGRAERAGEGEPGRRPTPAHPGGGARFPRLDPSQLSRHLPEIGAHLGDKAIRSLRKRGIEILLETGVTRLTPRSVELTDALCSTRTLVWTVGPPRARS